LIHRRSTGHDALDELGSVQLFDRHPIERLTRRVFLAQSIVGQCWLPATPDVAHTLAVHWSPTLPNVANPANNDFSGLYFGY
jgi:hypothetical protein